MPKALLKPDMDLPTLRKGLLRIQEIELRELPLPISLADELDGPLRLGKNTRAIRPQLSSQQTLAETLGVMWTS